MYEIKIIIHLYQPKLKIYDIVNVKGHLKSSSASRTKLHISSFNIQMEQST